MVKRLKKMMPLWSLNMYSVRIQRLLYKTVLKYYCGFYRFHYVPVLAGNIVYLFIKKHLIIIIIL